MHMRLFLKRNTFDDSCCFTVFDESEEVKYVASHVSSMRIARHRLAVADSAGEVVAKIRRLPLVGTDTYVLKFQRRHVTFVTLPTPNGSRSFFYGSNWRVTGEILSKNFSIIDVDKTLLLAHRKHADYCELLIPDERNELFCVAMSVCVNLFNTIESPALQAV